MLAAVLVLHGAVMSGPASATVTRTFSSGTFTARLSYDAKSVALNEKMTAPLTSAGPLGSFNGTVRNFYANLNANLDAAISQELAQNANGYSVKFNYGLLNGPMNLAMATENGLLRVTLSGPTYTASVTGSKSIVTCDSIVTLNSISFSFLYNPINGAVQGVTQAQLNPTQSTSCSNSLEFIPVLGDFINHWAAGLVNSQTASLLANSAAQISNAANGGQYQLFGLTSVIRPGQYVIDGVDVGAYIVNNFTYLLSTSGAMNITIGAPLTTASYVDTGPYSYLNATVFSFNFTNAAHNYGFALTEAAVYNQGTVCSGPNCTNLP
ncbi:conserved hypothetical protein [Ricinus communis]|uniref:Uncharacterized protein n=1 Tax=Ricinus communis TaxID=3988 RepID=B9TJW1_RICCO|nr:conserved hypothetical protein [Ricinus communis]